MPYPEELPDLGGEDINLDTGSKVDRGMFASFAELLALGNAYADDLRKTTEL